MGVTFGVNGTLSRKNTSVERSEKEEKVDSSKFELGRPSRNQYFFFLSPALHDVCEKASYSPLQPERRAAALSVLGPFCRTVVKKRSFCKIPHRPKQNRSVFIVILCCFLECEIDSSVDAPRRNQYFHQMWPKMSAHSSNF